MSKHEKLLKKFWKSPTPKDFTWKELETLLKGYYSYSQKPGNGSRVKFYCPNDIEPLISLHRPHPNPVVGPKCINALKLTLQEHSKESNDD